MAETTGSARALERGVRALERHQWKDGEWEGEVVWCPMLAAQYALTAYITEQPLSERRRRLLLRQFEATQLPSGLWGLHEHSQPYLFATTLVYVAVRTLGVRADDPLLAQARALFEREGGVAHIPSWGKIWLAMMNLYDWRGVNAVLPEAWLLPKWTPLHPSQYYCHTRMIYMGLAAVYGAKYQVPRSPLVEALRAELFPEGFAEVDWARARNALREEDLFAAPSLPLKLLYEVSQLVERLHPTGTRARVLADMRRRIRWELETTDYTCLSPVNGMPSLIALWIADPRDAHFKRGFERLEGWIWEDEQDGTRVSGARSASWDTAFAVQALKEAAPHVDVREPLARGVRFLESQQIRESFPDYREHFRADPKGGWCFAGVWHGWPVSDCTAEALVAVLGAPGHAPDRRMAADGARFILQSQNRDGGFGSYEHQRPAVGMEWCNPAEMFGDSMTELSYVECTASCIEGLAAIRERFPDVESRRIDRALKRAERWLRRSQHEDGTWPAAWGVNLVYGTMFGIRGLRALGADQEDPAIRRACRWIVEHQRADGGWGEHFEGALTGRYAELDHSHVIQTAWAMMALLAAGGLDWNALWNGARYLESMQGPDGEWPEQEMVGIFFHTALLHYRHYKRFFPVWALAMFETERRSRKDRPGRGVRPAPITQPQMS